MAITVDIRNKKVCSACKAESFGVFEEHTGRLAVASMNSVNIEDEAVVKRLGNIYAHVYICSQCNHMDFYILNSPKQVSMSQ